MDEFRQLGNEAVQDEKYEDACELYTKSIDTTGPNAAILCNRSLCHMKLGQYDQALSDAKAARSLDPTFVKAHFRVASALVAKNAGIDAILAVQDGLALAPHDHEFIQLLENARNGVPVFRPVPALFQVNDPTPNNEAYAAMVLFLLFSKPKEALLAGEPSFRAALDKIPESRYKYLLQDQGDWYAANPNAKNTRGLDLFFVLSMIDKDLHKELFPPEKMGDPTFYRCVRCGRVPERPYQCTSCGAMEFCSYECQEKSMWWHQDE
eukprot:PhF_6_TR32933/c1_g1_i2/m.48406